MRTWKNVEIAQGKGADAFRTFLKEKEIRYEPSGCGNLVHFEIYCNKEETLAINDFLYDLATEKGV